ncbi:MULTISPECIES: hypothetical protein [unclassified Mesorhizobium]|uniref:hypothetical protein n=1 Tax=unclassified Mesorhizobium TaxID=325217 RepID=UPI000BAF9179|nr:MULTISPECIES: hypothetical protein [unclassified Mesorhizobium]TGT61156.1 hypothetical protein EN813_019635 [Mesorhizobium sp. M00.F.Ca.ET.170.01.1.1]AZO08924.1 hypothetical protein EJ074_07255 [Mesorhizobium sp. M3A.F.Ca.ET.080.04.2.1]PBB84212.1 hypothetical protein CK216_24295 [Mesorhizobium sp. WSM3876]RWB68151.1 MAG: hypothetical protein EOQ49_23475 [Mesorhizobium sp.]RWB84606.1 MAG: hypothetical protein EOQ52_23775 [Mesorhizobium sp.]
MINPHVSKSGIAYPSDLALLKRIYDEVCQERGLTPGSPEASALAKDAMDIFAAGIFDEVTISRRLRRS